MNKVRERVLSYLKPYEDYENGKDLISVGISSEYFEYDYERDEDLIADFYMFYMMIEKDWLFRKMTEDGIENPSDYILNEYTWVDSLDWFEEASKLGKIAAIHFMDN